MRKNRYYVVNVVEMTILIRPDSGRNLVGMDSQVFLPIITAFCNPDFQRHNDQSQELTYRVERWK